MADEPNSKEVIPGVYWTRESKQKMEKFKKKHKLKNTKIYEYYGFASWFEGQLDGEIFAGVWSVSKTPIKPEDVFLP